MRSTSPGGGSSATPAPGVQLEASGGVDLETVRATAETGRPDQRRRVTHSAVALDVAARLDLIRGLSPSAPFGLEVIQALCQFSGKVQGPNSNGQEWTGSPGFGL